MMTDPAFSLIIPTLNEAARIEACLDSVFAQDTPEPFEVIVADGGSSDGTREIIRRRYGNRPDLRVIDNPRRIQAAAFNLGVSVSRAPIVVRLDAHCVFAPSYLRLIGERLREDDRRGNVGGGCDFAPGAPTRIGRAIAIFNQCRFGIGGASFRVGAPAGEVDTVPFGAFPRKVLETVGGMDEMLFRGEDNEYNARIAGAGYRIFFDPRIRCTYYCRPTLTGCLKQMYANGQSIGLLWKRAPYGIGLRHLVPLAFTAALLTALIAAPFHPAGRWLLAAVALPYLLANAAATIIAAGKFGCAFLPMLPWLFLLNHLAYGVGTLHGLVRYGLCPARQ